MIFSNLVATIRADLDAIKDDLGEFVTTVKTDTTAMLGLRPDGSDPNAPGGASNASKMLLWEEELWDNPDLLCEDPTAEDWKAFVESNPVKEQEVEVYLSGAESDVIPELYKELVPAKTTHADFFLRLVYHRNRMVQAYKARMQGLVANNNDEEETGWEDDDPEPVPAPKPAPPASKEESNQASAAATAALDQLKVENESLRSELSAANEELQKSISRIQDLEKLLAESEAARTVLLEEKEAFAELPHKKSPAANATFEDKTVSTEEISSVRGVTPSSTLTPQTVGTSWEALPTSPGSSSNEEPVVVLNNKQEEEEEEDDWE